MIAIIFQILLAGLLATAAMSFYLALDLASLSLQ